ncbi:hypothetical protein AK812_SmicGene4939 [Symbiodinium microadriaticum]|uniref:Uncharacterized protein n=1 Tax=Symbiodinium microadriaticum TaxID=2951 RepID=A0A1Q9EUZ0_SYMMI|nr:hypothetical protein AK812_SmicGene4939 [Symbiodinium microadriaticum]
MFDDDVVVEGMALTTKVTKLMMIAPRVPRLTKVSILLLPSLVLGGTGILSHFILREPAIKDLSPAHTGPSLLMPGIGGYAPAGQTTCDMCRGTILGYHARQGTPPTWDLGDMLQDTIGWDAEADIPEAQVRAGIADTIGFKWLLAKDGVTDLQDLANLFADSCPPDRLFGVKGDFTPDTAHDASEDDEGVAGVDATFRAHFVVAVPGYVLEKVCVEIVVPATPQEVYQWVQHARNHETSSLFPDLVAVRPQPCPGTGVLIGCAEWDIDSRIVCIDTTAIDHRIFAVKAPAYANSAQLIALAQLPHNAGFAVLAGGDQQPLPDATVIHIARGDLFTFVPEDHAPRDYHTFEQVEFQAGRVHQVKATNQPDFLPIVRF